MQGDDKPGLKEFRSAMQGGGPDLATIFEENHPADVAGWLLECEPDQAWSAVRTLDTDARSELLQYAGDALRAGILARMEVQDMVDVVEHMPADEVVDLLALVDDEKTELVLRAVDFERAQGLRELAAYAADTAGGLMTTEFVAVPAGTRVGDAIKEIKAEKGPAGEEEIGIFVVDGSGKPVGYVSDRDLLTSGIHTQIDEVMETDLITARAGDDQEDVAHQIRKYSLWAIPVVDGRERLIGIISAEDVRDVLEDEAEEDILRLVGTSPAEQTRLPVLTRVRHRIPMQALTVVGGLLTARILEWALPDSIQGPSSDVLRYLPIIIGLAGNVGIQSSTVLVRAFATGEVTKEREWPVLLSEVLVGLTIGLLCGAVTFLISAHMEGSGGPDFGFGGAVGVAIFLAVTWAAMVGCLVPMLCQRLGIDPAIVAGPFMITLSDISGAAIFIGVAHLMLGIGRGLGSG